jgi:hypothetical protein
MRASVELDHFMIWVPRSYSEDQIVSMLGAVGFNPEIDRKDFGNGRIGRYLLFWNMYPELLWVEDESKLPAGEAHLIDVVVDSVPLLEVALDARKQNKQIDLRPRPPLLLHFRVLLGTCWRSSRGMASAWRSGTSGQRPRYRVLKQNAP